MSSYPSSNHDTNTLTRETSKARDVTLHARKLVSKLWHHLDCTCSACTAMRTKCLTFGTVPDHVTSFGCLEKQDKFALMFCSGTHLTRSSLKLPVTRLQRRPVLGFWTALSEIIRCQTPAYHDSTCGEVGLRYGVKVRRHSHLYIVPFCRTCAMTGMRAALSCMYLHTVSDVKRRNFSCAVKLFVEKSH